MTNQPTERWQSGRPSGRRGSGYGRGIAFGLSMLGLLAAVSPTWAAEVVEVRVGRHPEFTRVVFELDHSAGYRIERSDPSAKESELIISLEAGSIPRRIQSSKSFIEQVVVEPSGTRSIARIRLARGGLRLKEMILASPPRIVLDVIAENGGATSTAKSSSSPTVTKAVATTPARTSAPEAPKPTTASIPPTPKPTAVIANAAPTPKATQSPTPTPAASPATPPKTRVLASTEDPNAKTPSPAPAANAAATPTNIDPTAAEAGGVDPGANAANEWNDGGATDPEPAGLADGSADGIGSPDAAVAATEPPKARPMMVKSSDSEDAEGGGLVNWSLAGVGLAIAAFAGLVVARRRRAAAEVEDDDDEASEDAVDGEEDEEDEEASSSASSNPFAELTGGSASLASGMTRSGPSAARSAQNVTDKPEKKPSESLLFDDAEEKTMESMDVVSRSQGNEGLGGAMPMMGAGSDELTQMFREMQRRVAALEGRIDELVDARDRLERQVAAQTEELRVQRAAIARTQRAVRNLARPEEGNDDEPTEPALRDPS